MVGYLLSLFVCKSHAAPDYPLRGRVNIDQSPSSTVVVFYMWRDTPEHIKTEDLSFLRKI